MPKLSCSTPEPGNPDPTRSVYLDIEADKAGRFYLATYRYRGETVTVSLDPSLADWAERCGFEPLTPADLWRRLKALCVAQGATLVAWSRAEGDYLSTVCAEPLPVFDLCAASKSRLRKLGLWISYKAQAPKKAKGVGKLRPLALTSFVRWSIAESPPAMYALGRTTERLRSVAEALARKGSLTPTLKRKWTNVLKHNQWDAEVLERIHRMWLIGADERIDARTVH